MPLQGDNSWIRRHELGPKAFNDATLLQCGINVLLNKHFSGDSRYSSNRSILLLPSVVQISNLSSRYLHYIQTFQEGILSNSVSNLLAFRDHPSRRPGLANYREDEHLVELHIVDIKVSCPGWLLIVSVKPKELFQFRPKPNIRL